MTLYIIAGHYGHSDIRKKSVIDHRIFHLLNELNDELSMPVLRMRQKQNDPLQTQCSYTVHGCIGMSWFVFIVIVCTTVQDVRSMLKEETT